MQRLKILLKNELPFNALIIFSKTIIQQLTGRFHAYLLGWNDGYLGYHSKVIGSNAIRVGANSYIHRLAWIEAVHNFRGQVFSPKIYIGKSFSASESLHISCINRVEIGDGCLFGSGVYISDHNHGNYNGSNQSTPFEMPVDRALFSTGPVVIGSNVWLGDNVVIVGPVRIGDGAVIGANSVIKKDIPCNVIAAGAPIRILKKFNPASGRWEKI